MSYVGNTPSYTAYQPGQDAFAGTGTATTFTLSRVATSIQVEVTVENVVQFPEDYFDRAQATPVQVNGDTVNGSYTITTANNVSTLVFAVAPPAPIAPNTRNILVRYIAQASITAPPSAGSVGATELATNNSPGAANTVLTVASLSPTVLTWATPAGGVGSFSAGTTGFTPNSATTGVITLGGTLGVTNGGTGVTSAASIQSTYGVPTNSVVLFYQASAPTGWTQVTTLNDYALRIVSGTGGSTGGTTAFSTVFTNQTITITGLSVGATTLSIAQMPSHTHTYPTAGQASGYTGYLAGGNPCQPTCSTTSSSTGGGGSHTHSISGSASGNVTLDVRYANIILCSKS